MPSFKHFPSSTDGTANRSIPFAPSKPVYLHNIRCTSRDLSLLECGFTRYSEDTKPRIHVQDAIIRCQQRKFKNYDLDTLVEYYYPRVEQLYLSKYTGYGSKAFPQLFCHCLYYICVS